MGVTLLSIYWDPNSVLFNIPYLQLDIRWYGFLFALGFFTSYLLLKSLFRIEIEENQKHTSSTESPSALSQLLLDRLIWFVFFGTLIGARLGHVFFYQWEFFWKHPWEIVQVWHGGLASHGAVVGIPIALYFFYRANQDQLPDMSFLRFFDMFCIIVPLTGAFIRIGNFFNQEIIGTPSSLPWAVIFGTPFDGSIPIPRHPVQLYEAISYLFTFALLLFLWKTKKDKAKPGFYSGLFFILVFSFRFIIEVFKTAQSEHFRGASIDMGQWLSLPCIAIGVVLLSYSLKKSCKKLA